MPVSEQEIRDARWSVKASADVEKGKAIVLATYTGTGGTAAESTASNDKALGMSSRAVDSGETIPVQLGEGSVVEFTASGAVTKGDKLNPQGTAGDLGTCPYGSEYIGESLQTLADGETGVMVLTRGVNVGSAPQKEDEAMIAKANIASVFPSTGLWDVVIYIQNTTANAVTGGLNIGTSDGGTDISSAQAVGANALVRVTDFVNITVAGTAVYFDAVTAWNSASLKVYVQAKKIA